MISLHFSLTLFEHFLIQFTHENTRTHFFYRKHNFIYLSREYLYCLIEQILFIKFFKRWFEKFFYPFKLIFFSSNIIEFFWILIQLIFAFFFSILGYFFCIFFIPIFLFFSIAWFIFVCSFNYDSVFLIQCYDHRRKYLEYFKKTLSAYIDIFRTFAIHYYRFFFSNLFKFNFNSIKIFYLIIFSTGYLHYFLLSLFFFYFLIYFLLFLCLIIKPFLLWISDVILLYSQRVDQQNLQAEFAEGWYYYFGYNLFLYSFINYIFSQSYLHLIVNIE